MPGLAKKIPAGFAVFGLVASLIALPPDVTAGPPRLPPEHFPVDAAMRKRVEFWKTIYTEVSNTEVLLHDDEDPTVVYKKIPLGGREGRARRNYINAHKKEIGEVLKSLAKKGKTDLTDKEAEMLSKVGERDPRELLRMSKSVRAQQGLREPYYEGLVRSYLYLDRIKEIFREEGLPEELAYLPHVESSFNYRAYSKVGAAGIWQFMRSTARLYRLKINYIIDERRDPLAATRAAARFLRDNYARLQSWPLALTAYNHGPVSIEKAVRQLGTRDLSKIIDSYDGRRFGFASKNFYATYVATAEISMNPERYFAEVPKAAPFVSSEFALERPATIRQIAKATGVSVEDLKTHNRELRPIAFQSNIYLPRGHVVKVPPVEAAVLAEYSRKVAALGKGAPVPSDVKVAGEHIVAPGESLYVIAKAYGTSVTDLLVLNEITTPSRIIPGTRLKLPGQSDELAKKKAALVAAADARRPEPEPAPAAVAAVTTTPVSNETATEPGEPATSPVEALSDAATETDSPTELAQETDTDAGEKSGFFDRMKFMMASSAIPSRPRSLKEWVRGKAPASVETETLPEDAEAAAAASPAPPPIPVARAEQIEKREDREEASRKIPEFDSSTYDLDAEPVTDGVVAVRVEAEETLSHFAEWAGVSAARIRALNGLRYGQDIRMGQRLRLPLSKEKLVAFNLARVQYHQAMEEDLYANYSVSGVSEYKVKRGDTVARITKKLNIPYWLLKKYQPQGFEGTLVVGQVLRIPQLQPVSDDATTAVD